MSILPIRGGKKPAYENEARKWLSKREKTDHTRAAEFRAANLPQPATTINTSENRFETNLFVLARLKSSPAKRIIFCSKKRTKKAFFHTKMKMRRQAK